MPGGAIKQSLEKNPDNLALLQTMYNEWPFFQVTIDLIEMVFAKADPRVAEMYDRLLVRVACQNGLVPARFLVELVALWSAFSSSFWNKETGKGAGLHLSKSVRSYCRHPPLSRLAFAVGCGHAKLDDTDAWKADVCTHLLFR